MEYDSVGYWPVLLSLFPGNNNHPGPAVSSHPRIRTGSDRAGRDLDGCFLRAASACGWVPAAFERGPSFTPRSRFCEHGFRIPPERRNDERLVSGKLLPHRISDGIWSMLCVHRSSRSDHIAGTFLGWIGEAPAHPHLFCLLS